MARLKSRYASSTMRQIELGAHAAIIRVGHQA
jgi:hypothetical protein